MIEFEKPNITKIDENKDYGVFVVEPLERGYGTTLGNSLRRVLLASLPGAAVTSINIEVTAAPGSEARCSCHFNQH